MMILTAIFMKNASSGLTTQAQRCGEGGAGRAQARTVTASEHSLQRLVRHRVKHVIIGIQSSPLSGSHKT